MNQLKKPIQTKLSFSLQLIFCLLICTISASTFADEQKIGLIYNHSQCKMLNESRSPHDVLANYTRVIEYFNFSRIPICIGLTDQQLKLTMATLTGLIIPGGSDIDPTLYQEPLNPKSENIDKEFDIFEIKVFNLAKENEIPILGICKGLQIINVALGGSLYQDIPSELHSSASVTHRKIINNISQPIHHNLQIKTYSNLHRFLNTDHLTVNSYHHQGIKSLGSQLIPLAHSDDGLIEAIENTSGTPIFALQFHPEKDFDQPEMKKILRYYFEKLKPSDH